MKIFNLPFQCIGRLHRGHSILTKVELFVGGMVSILLEKGLDYSDARDLLVLP